MQLHHEGKLCSTYLVVYYFFGWWITTTFVAFQTSLSSFFSKDLQDGLVLWCLLGVFTQEVASDSTQITVATWIQRLPKEWSSRTLGQQSQLSHSPLTQRTQIIQYCYQRNNTTHMEHYVAFHQLTYEWLHRYNQFGYWLTSFSYLKECLPRLWSHPLQKVVLKPL